MRKRETEAATTQMGCLGAEDPAGISGRTPCTLAPKFIARGAKEVRRKLG
jgi:hypothetical protein